MVGKTGGCSSPRSGFFHRFTPGQVLAKRFDPQDEEIKDVGPEDADRIGRGLNELDRSLGPYPYDTWKKWVSLTNKISDATIAR